MSGPPEKIAPFHPRWSEHSPIGLWMKLLHACIAQPTPKGLFLRFKMITLPLAIPPMDEFK